MSDKRPCMAKVVWSYLLLPEELAQEWLSASEYKYFF